MKIRLVVANGKQAGKEIPISKSTFVIGREEGCQLRPRSNQVSRKHCVILVEEGSAAIEDCGSTNGTFVNNEKIQQRRELNSGDRIKVGALELDVQLAVSTGGKNKPKVHGVQEAAARAAASVPTGEDDLDISSWLGEDDKTDLTATHEQPSTGNDTIADKSMVDTDAMPIVPPARKEEEKKEEEKKKGTPTKVAGKFHHPVKPVAESSGTAAADVLRDFFHRKKP